MWISFSKIEIVREPSMTSRIQTENMMTNNLQINTLGIENETKTQQLEHSTQNSMKDEQRFPIFSHNFHWFHQICGIFKNINTAHSPTDKRQQTNHPTEMIPNAEVSGINNEFNWKDDTKTTSGEEKIVPPQKRSSQNFEIATDKQFHPREIPLNANKWRFATRKDWREIKVAKWSRKMQENEWRWW